MSILGISLGEFELQVDVDVIHWPLPEKVNAMPEDCYEAEEGMLEWTILDIEANDPTGLDVDEFASAVGSPQFEELLWEAISKETIY